jgi:hypothetical protein
MKRKICVGNIFDLLTVIEIINCKPPQCICQCKCGRQKTVSNKYLFKKNRFKSCGICIYRTNSINIGDIFGKLTVISKAETKRGDKQFLCQCECGEKRTVPAYKLTSPSSKIESCRSCGNIKHTVNVGDRFGKLVVIAKAEPVTSIHQRHRAFLCRCDCGNEKIIRAGYLVRKE